MLNSLANEWMNAAAVAVAVAEAVEVGTVTVTSRTCKKERNFTVRLQVVKERARTHKHKHRLTRILSRWASVWESARERVKVKFTATATTPAPRLFVLLRTRCVRDERRKSTEFAGKHTAAARLRRRLWLNLLDEQLSSWARRQRQSSSDSDATAPLAALAILLGSAVAFNCLGVASRRVDHYLSAAQLHYELRACVCVCECVRESVRLMTNFW